MAGEPILIVDDTPVNLKLTRILLVNEGYKVIIAASAEEALELLRGYHPRLILCDIQLPGMDGLELTRRLKQEESTRDIVVIALTAYALKGDEQRAIEAGCDGYITKPIDTRTLGARLREYLDRSAPPPLPDGAPVTAGTPAPSGALTSELLALKRKFLSEGQDRVRQWLLDLEGRFEAAEAARVAHQWIGTGGMLGYTAIGRLAREAEAILQERPLDSAQLRQTLTELALAFNSPREARDAPVPDSIVRALSGKRVAVVALPSHEAQRLCAALERASAIPVFLAASEPPDSQAARECDLAVVHADAETAGSPWLSTSAALSAGLPVVFVGSRDDLLELDPEVQ
jgi:CheY-like chemotaxis protein